MSGSNASKFLSLAIASLFLVTLLPIGLATQPTPAQRDQVSVDIANDGGNTGPKGEDVPQGTWQSFNEQLQLFFRNAGSSCAHAPSTPCLSFTRPGSGNAFSTLYSAQGDIATNTVPGNQNEVIFPYGQVTSPFTLFQLSTDLYLATGESYELEVQLLLDGAPIGTPVELEINNFGKTLPAQPVSVCPGSQYCLYSPTQVTGVASYGPAGVPVGEGQLDVAIRATPTVALGLLNAGYALALAYDRSSNPSSITIHGDTAAVNVWTEDVNGVTTNAFPLAPNAPSPQRTAVLRVAHANSLGDHALDHRFSGAFLAEEYNGHEVQVRNDQFIFFDSRDPSLVDAPDGEAWNVPQVHRSEARVDSDSDGLRLYAWDLVYPSVFSGDGQFEIRINAHRQFWSTIHEVAVGGTGLEIERAPFESRSKEILQGESTTFQLRVTNSGVVDDVVLVSVANPGSGWSASIAPFSQFPIAAGASTELELTVVPSAGALVGDAKTIVVTAVSSLGGKTDTEELIVRITDQVVKGVDLLSEVGSVQAAPGQVRNVPLAVRNLANFGEQYIIVVSGAPLGWTATVTPSLVDLPAKGQNAAVLTLRAPAEADRGTSFNLQIQVVSVNDLDIFKTLTLPVEVFLEDRFFFQVFTGTDADGNPIGRLSSSATDPILRAMRDEGPDANPFSSTDPLGLFGSSPWNADVDPDIDQDQSTIFKLMLVNDGDRDDIIRLRPDRLNDPALGYQSLIGCETGDYTVVGASDIFGLGGVTVTGRPNDGINDGWRFRLWDPEDPLALAALPGPGLATKQSDSTIRNFDQLVSVPAHSTKFVYAEFGWVIPDPALENNVEDHGLLPSPCWQTVQGGSGNRGADPAPGEGIKIEAISQNDPTQRSTHVLNARLDANGGQSRILSQKYSDQANQVFLHIDPNDETDKSVQQSSSSTDRTTQYRLTAVNGGNEMERLRISVPVTQDGWIYDIPELEIDDQTLVFQNLVEGHGTAPPAVGCDSPRLENDRILVECLVGSHDEVSFNVHVTAPTTAALLDIDVLDVVLESKDSFTDATIKRDIVPLFTKVTGTHLFSVLPDPASGTINTFVYPGQDAFVPFTIRNLGTASDEFDVSLLKAPDLSTGWRGTFSQPAPVFIAGEHDWHGFLSVHAPSDAEPGSLENFRVKVENLDDPLGTIRVVDVVARVLEAPSELSVTVSPTQQLGLPGEKTEEIKVTAIRQGTAATRASFNLDTSVLPSGWSVTDSTAGQEQTFDQDGEAVASFRVQVPDDQIGTSRVVIPVSVTDNAGNTRLASAVVGLASAAFTVELDLINETILPVVPGDIVDVPVRVKNNGLSSGTVQLRAPALPTGWAASASEPNVALQPLESRDVVLTFSVPDTMTPGEKRLIAIEARTATGAVLDTLAIEFSTGSSVLTLTPKDGSEQFRAPLETFNMVVEVANNGDVPDVIRLEPALTGGFRDIVQVSFSEPEFRLEPEESRDVTVTVTMPEILQAGTLIPVVLQASSKGPLLSSVGTTTVNTKVLDFRSLDADGDGLMEYAVDRDRDASNGFEETRDPFEGGLNSTSLDMSRFLSAEAVEDFTVIVTDADGNSEEEFQFLLDGDEDGRIDHFLDTDGDGLPNAYWDPDRGAAHTIRTTKDVSRDGILEYFVDLDGDGLLDAYYNVITGQWGGLIQVDIDGEVAYVVDLNGNNEPDESEPILLTRDGRVVAIQEKVDMDGNGKLDTVVDEDGDGIPDYFIPNGKSKGIPIVLEDVTGDGIADWTYDANGDGKRDSYYDPASGESGLIDSRSVFLRAIITYWYVGALFGLVLVLFGVLLAVTRR